MERAESKSMVDVPFLSEERKHYWPVMSLPSQYEDPAVMSLPSQHEDIAIFENKTGLSEDMKFLASMPELCDVTFLVGDTREPVTGVRAILAARSRVFRALLYDNKRPSQDPPARLNMFRNFIRRSSEPLNDLKSGKKVKPLAVISCEYGLI